MKNKILNNRIKIIKFNGNKIIKIKFMNKIKLNKKKFKNQALNKFKKNYN